MENNKDEVLDDRSRLNELLATSEIKLNILREFIKSIGDRLDAIIKLDSSTKVHIAPIISEIRKEIRQDLIWQQFESEFSVVHGDFLSRLRKSYPELTTQDQKLCAYLRLELSSKDIAKLLSISVRGVEVARYRLRRRLSLETKQHLMTFILEF